MIHTEPLTLQEKKIAILGHGLRLVDQWMAQQMNRSLREDPFGEVIQEGGALHVNEKLRSGKIHREVTYY